MADINLKTETPDTTLPTTGFLFGADSQAAASPSVYSTQTVATTLLGSTTLTGATITADAPVLNLAQTWNDGGTTFTGLKFNATDTASANGSLLMDLQVGGASRARVGKNGYVYALRLYGGSFGSTYLDNGTLTLNNQTSVSADNTVCVIASGSFYQSIGIEGSDCLVGRRAAANLRLGAADTSASATITVTIAAPGVVTWSNHSLSTGSPVIFTTTGALPTGITADTTYYAIVVNANTFQLASSFANALAGTAITTSGTQSGTHTGRRGAIAQQFGPQDTLSTGSLENINGADFVIRGSRSIGNKPGGSIIFQVAPAGTTGSAQNALATALTIDSTRLATFSNAIGLGAPGSVWRLIPSGTTSLVFWDTSNSDAFAVGPYNQGIAVTSAGSIGWSSTTSPSLSSRDVILTRDTANTLALRNGTNAQTFNVYNTFTSSTNFERFRIVAQSAAAVLIGTEKGSGGGTARALALQTDGTTRLTIADTGIVTFTATQTDPVKIIGSVPYFGGLFLQNTNGGNAGSTGFTAQNNQTSQLLTRVYSSGTSSSIWGIALANYAAVFSDGASSNGLMIGTLTADPVIFGTDTSEKMRITSAGLITFGGIASSFPALKRSSASLQVRLADDSANAALESASIKTDAPTGGTAATWKLGTVATVSPTSPNRTIEVEIGGTTYYISAKTTND